MAEASLRLSVGRYAASETARRRPFNDDAAQTLTQEKGEGGRGGYGRERTEGKKMRGKGGRGSVGA